MEEQKREWGKFTPSEKLIAIDAYLDGMAKLDDSDEALNNGRIEWLRAHLPAYDPAGGKNYIFVSYSHLDYKNVYRDLAYFSYNSKQRVRFWYDEGLPVGKDWEAAAGKLLSDSRCVGVIFYLSKNLLLSPSVFKEIQAVKKYKKPYFAIALNGGEYFAGKIISKFSTEELLSVEDRREDLEEFFPDSHTAITYYGDTAFARINKIAQFFDVTEDVFADFVCEEVKDGLALIKYNGDDAEIHIPEKIDGKPVAEIRREFFEIKATSVYIPKTVKRIEADGYFSAAKPYYCDFEKFIVDKRNKNYYDINGVLCTKKGTIVRAPVRWSWKEQFVQPDNGMSRLLITEATSEIDFAIYFEGKRDALQININAFTGIMNFLFTDDKNLDGDFKEKVKKIRCDKGLFYENCLKLKEKSLFNGITEIAGDAFIGCTDIDYIFLPDTVQRIGNFAFRDSNIKLVCLSENLEEIPINCFAYCTRLSTVLTKCDYAKYGNKYSIRDALIFGKVNAICDNAFENTFIEHLVLGEKVKVTGNFAFEGCYLLNTVTFTAPQKLEIFNRTFMVGCTNLSEIIFNGAKEEWKRLWNKNPFETYLATIKCTDGVIPPGEE